MSNVDDANLRNAQRWLKQAEDQLTIADWNGQGRHWDAACFFAQQAAELALKALLIRQGERIRTHGVLHLVERVSVYVPGVSGLADAARSLDRFYITTRYPDALPHGTSKEYFCEADFKSAHTAATRILTEARAALE